jgi:hypothetical protein
MDRRDAASDDEEVSDQEVEAEEEGEFSDSGDDESEGGEPAAVTFDDEAGDGEVRRQQAEAAWSATTVLPAEPSNFLLCRKLKELLLRRMERRRQRLMERRTRMRPRQLNRW